MIQSNMEHSILARFFCLLLLFITNGCSAATTMNNALSSNTHFWTPVLTLTAGSAFNIDTQASRDFPAQNGVLSFYHYDGEHTNQTIALFGGFIGIVNEINEEKRKVKLGVKIFGRLNKGDRNENNKIYHSIDSIFINAKLQQRKPTNDAIANKQFDNFHFSCID